MTYGQQPYTEPMQSTTTYDTTAQYVYEQARQSSVNRAYGQMAIGLAITAVTSWLTAATGFYISFLMATGMIGIIGLAAVQVMLAIYLGARIMKMSTTTAHVLFYVYSALMGVTLSTIFLAYNIGTIAFAFVMSAIFFLALSMFGLTTKRDMLKAGPILMVALIIFIVAQLLITFIFPAESSIRIICAIGLVLFAGMAIHDAQATRAILTQVESQGPEMVKKASILCALNLYLDFVNIFIYILQLLGNRD